MTRFTTRHTGLVGDCRLFVIIANDGTRDRVPQAAVLQVSGRHRTGRVQKKLLPLELVEVVQQITIPFMNHLGAELSRVCTTLKLLWREWWWWGGENFYASRLLVAHNLECIIYAQICALPSALFLASFFNYFYFLLFRLRLAKLDFSFLILPSSLLFSVLLLAFQVSVLEESRSSKERIEKNCSQQGIV